MKDCTFCSMTVLKRIKMKCSSCHKDRTQILLISVSPLFVHSLIKLSPCFIKHLIFLLSTSITFAAMIARPWNLLFRLLQMKSSRLQLVYTAWIRKKTSSTTTSKPRRWYFNGSPTLSELRTKRKLNKVFWTPSSVILLLLSWTGPWSFCSWDIERNSLSGSGRGE